MENLVDVLGEVLAVLAMGGFTGACIRIARSEMPWSHWLGVVGYLATLLWGAHEFPEFRWNCYGIIASFGLGCFIQRVGQISFMMLSLMIVSGPFSWLGQTGHFFYLLQATLLGCLLAWLGRLRRRPREQLAVPLLFSPVLAQCLWFLDPTPAKQHLSLTHALFLGAVLGVLDWLRLNDKFNPPKLPATRRDGSTQRITSSAGQTLLGRRAPDFGQPEHRALCLCWPAKTLALRDRDGALWPPGRLHE